jgi:hypothetical protein
MLGAVWTVLALVLLAPIGWALLGAEPIPSLGHWISGAASGLVPEAASGLDPELVPTTTLVLALGAGALLGLGGARFATTHLSTLAHELGHGLTAALLGGRIDRITLAREGSGMAHYTAPRRWRVRRLVVSFVGYLAPGVFGVASVRVALAGHGPGWLAYLVILLGTMLVLTLRSWWAVLLAIVLGAGAWALLALGSAWLATVVVAGLAGALLGGGTVDAAEQWRLARVRGATDAASMATQTGLPVRVFAGLHVVLAVALAGVGIALPVLG